MPPRTRKESADTAPTPREDANMPPVEPDVKEPPAEPTTCGANLADFNAYYRDIFCVLDAEHAGAHSDGDKAFWPNENDLTPEVSGGELCTEHYPAGWPSTEVGASAGCPHGTWVYEG